MWVPWQLKSSAIKLFVQQLVEANKKEMLHVTGHLWWEQTGYCGFSSQRANNEQKKVHVMMSSHIWKSQKVIQLYSNNMVQWRSRSDTDL